MTTDRISRRCWPVGLILALGWGAWAFVSPAASTNTPPWELPIPKSTFIEDPKIGRDPFFPRSTRRAPKAPVPTPDSGEASKTASVKALSDRLRLQGITGRVALINQVDFVAGQESEVKIPNGKLKIRCVAVRQNSVVIQVQGDTETKILQLAD